MTTTTPIACSLGAADLTARLDRMRVLAGHALLERTPIPGGARLTFAARPGVEAELREIAAAEAACCAFLDIAITAAGAGVAAEITGPAEAAPIIAELFA